MARSTVPLRVLFGCVGRRVELVQAFRAAGRALRLKLELWGSDHVKTAPALQFVDRRRLVPSISESDYIDYMLRLVRRERIAMLIPLIDFDLTPLANAKARFAAAGCTVIISDAPTVAICRDKLAAFHHLHAAGIDTPRTWTVQEVLSRRRHRLPYFVKPRCGSAGMGLHVIETDYDLEQVPRWVDDAIVQEFVEGVEYTLDAYTGLDGRGLCVVPRRRIRIRSGEVSQAQVELDRNVIAVGRRVVRSLPGCAGVITIQCIKTDDGRIKVIEINPRFGGGAPLSIAAGADFPRWLLSEFIGRRPRIPPTARRDGLMMSRYDQSVFQNAPPCNGR